MSDATDRLEKLAEQSGLELEFGMDGDGRSAVWIYRGIEAIGEVKSHIEAYAFIAGWCARGNITARMVSAQQNELLAVVRDIGKRR